MTDRAGPHRRTPRWLVLFGVLTLLCSGVFAISTARSRITAGRQHQAERAIRATLDRQGAALLRGDRAGWLAPADPVLTADLRRLYDNLRGLRVTGWLPRTRRVQAGARWTTEIQVRVCFAAPVCPRTPETYVPLGEVLRARTEWSVTGDRATLTAFERIGPDGALPWRSGTLTFAAGPRVVVAAPQDVPGIDPQEWLPAAERAARVADRYAPAGSAPDRYYVWLADPNQWTAATGQDREAAAFVDRTSETTAFAIVDATGFGADPDDERLLRHELGHIATLRGTLNTREEWVIEGLAEHIAYAGEPVSANLLVDYARAEADRIGWDGRLDREWSAAPADRSGHYAMAFLAVRCLAETYGEPALLTFFRQVVHQGEQPVDAAPVAFGTSWAWIQTACKPKIDNWLTG